MTAPLSDPRPGHYSARRDQAAPGAGRRLTAALSKIWSLAWFLLAGTENIVSIWPNSAYKKKRRAFRILFRRIFVISDPEGVEYVMLTRVDNFRKSDVAQRMLKPLIGESMFITHGEHWKRQRRIATPAFHSRHVRAFTTQMTSATQEMLARWEPSANGSELEISREMTRVTADVICRTMFSDDLGTRVDQVYDAFSRYQAPLGRLAIAELTGLPAWLPRLQSPTGHKAAAELDAIVSEIIARRRARQGTQKDLLSLLLDAVDPKTGERLSDRLVRDEVLFLFLAGHETTVNAMVWLWYLLSQSPEVERRVHEEVDRVLEGREPDFQATGALHYLRATIQEAMRLYPPVHTYAREAVEDDRIGDQRVPAGSLVVVSP